MTRLSHRFLRTSGANILGMAAASNSMTVAEYLEFEKHSEVKHEFVDGKLVELSATPGTHVIIVKNILEILKEVAVSSGFKLHSFESKLQTRHARFRYPDVVISSNLANGRDLIEKPRFLAEVTSEHTFDTDRMQKVAEYLSIDSVEGYAIVLHASRFVSVFRREGEFKTFDLFHGSGEFEIPCLGVSLSLDQIYANLEI
jgi:Uma2 family endonuclease